MPWRERFRDYLYKEAANLKQRADYLESGKCEMWESTDGLRKNVTEEHVASLRARIAEIEQMLVEEGLS